MNALIEKIFFNGNIITLTASQPRVAAVAVREGRVVAVGDDASIRALAGSHTREVNLGGQTVIPGLIDAHLHWQWTSSTMQEVNLYEIPSKEAALDAVAERVKETKPGVWIRGHGWVQDLWPDKSFPTAADLDRVAPDNPVYLTGKSVHVAWVNSAALRLAGVTASTSDPEGGSIYRAADGNPTGILFESPAMRLVSNMIPPLTAEHIADQMLAAQEKAHSQGLTAFHDLDDPICLEALQILRERGQLSLRALKYINKAYIEAAIRSGMRFGFGDDWIRIGGLKLFADGALGPRTALMIEPYEGEPWNCGIAVTPKEEMRKLVHQASMAGLPTAIHAIGDRAVRDVLDVFEHVRAEEAMRGIPRQARRHRIEHVQLIHPDDVHRLAALDIIASIQPIHATSDAFTADRYWGERAALSYNARVQIDQGARVAFGSDSPVEPFNPIMGIYAAVTRKRPDGSLGPEGWRPDARLTVDETLRGFTQGPAYAAGTEDRQGFIGPGAYADMVLLDRDPYACEPDELKDMTVLGTMVDGVWRYGGTD